MFPFGCCREPSCAAFTGVDFIDGIDFFAAALWDGRVMVCLSACLQKGLCAAECSASPAPVSRGTYFIKDFLPLLLLLG